LAHHPQALLHQRSRGWRSGSVYAGCHWPIPCGSGRQ